MRFSRHPNTLLVSFRTWRLQESAMQRKFCQEITTWQLQVPTKCCTWSCQSTSYHHNIIIYCIHQNMALDIMIKYDKNCISTGTQHNLYGSSPIENVSFQSAFLEHCSFKMSTFLQSTHMNLTQTNKEMTVSLGMLLSNSFFQRR